MTIKYSKSSERKFTSLKHFSWDSKINKSHAEKLIQSTILEWYDAKHRIASDDEISFINNINIESCPFCDSNKIVKNGHTVAGIQKFKCKNCLKQFNTLSGTIFDSKKIPISEWIEYLLHLFEFHSIKTSAIDNRNSTTTGIYWLKKVFAVLDGIQDNVVLDGTIYLDEMLLPVIKSKVITKNGKKLRGISRNKINVACAINDKGKSILIVGSSCKPNDESTYLAYGNHIKEGSIIVHDGEKSHNYLIEKLNLNSVVYKTNETKGLKDEDNPLDPINDLHSYAKRFFKNHGAYDREFLQDWLNLFWFIANEPNDKYDKVLIFIEKAIKTRKTIRFRDALMNK